MSASIDLWGNPIPEQPALTGLDGPHHLEIPAWCAEWLRESLLRERDLAVRDRRIRELLDDERRRQQRRDRQSARWKAGNPLVVHFGPGPDGARCKTCAHFHVKQYAGTYFKCDLRGDTNGPGTDHRANWPACGRYEQG